MIPPIFKRATMRCMGFPDAATGEVAFALDCADGTHRFRMGRSELLRLAAAIADHLRESDQSPISSGNPKREGSPQLGQSVCPPAKSSSALCGEA